MIGAHLVGSWAVIALDDLLTEVTLPFPAADPLEEMVGEGVQRLRLVRR